MKSRTHSRDTVLWSYWQWPLSLPNPILLWKLDSFFCHWKLNLVLLPKCYYCLQEIGTVETMELTLLTAVCLAWGCFCPEAMILVKAVEQPTVMVKDVEQPTVMFLTLWFAYLSWGCVGCGLAWGCRHSKASQQWSVALLEHWTYSVFVSKD